MLVNGVMKGFDKLDNIVLDDCLEYLRGNLRFMLSTSPVANFVIDPEDAYRVTDRTRNLGLVVCRGTQISFLSHVEGLEEIANPFTDVEAADEEADIRVES